MRVHVRAPLRRPSVFAVASTTLVSVRFTLTETRTVVGYDAVDDGHVVPTVRLGLQGDALGRLHWSLKRRRRCRRSRPRTCSTCWLASCVADAIVAFVTESRRPWTRMRDDGDCDDGEEEHGDEHLDDAEAVIGCRALLAKCGKPWRPYPSSTSFGSVVVGNPVDVGRHLCTAPLRRSRLGVPHPIYGHVPFAAEVESVIMTCRRSTAFAWMQNDVGSVAAAGGRSRCHFPGGDNGAFRRVSATAAGAVVGRAPFVCV